MKGSDQRRWAVRHRFDIALVGLLLAVVAPFVQTLTAQGAARYTLTAAILEHHTLRLDDYAPIVGFDRVELNGHLYSDKAPGQPLLGVPVLGIAEAVGAEPATDFRTRGNLGLWSQTLVFCTLPAAVLLLLMRRHAARTAPARCAAVAAIAMSFGTMLLPFSTSLYGHMFVTALGFGAWHLLTARSATRRDVLLAGTLAALAVGSEYPMFYVAAVLGLWVLLRRGIRDAVVFGLPTLGVLPLLLLYNRAVYSSNATGYSAKTEGGRLNFLSLPKIGNVVQILFGGRGFVFTPIVLVGIAFLCLGLWQRRFELIVPAAVLGGFFLLQAGWGNPYGGEGPGPRYITPALPFLVVPIAAGIRKLSTLFTVIILSVGMVSMGLVIITYELVPLNGALIFSHLHNLSTHGLNPTIFTMALGPSGWLVHLLLIGVAARAVAGAWPSAEWAPEALD